MFCSGPAHSASLSAYNRASCCLVLPLHPLSPIFHNQSQTQNPKKFIYSSSSSHLPHFVFHSNERPTRPGPQENLDQRAPQSRRIRTEHTHRPTPAVFLKPVTRFISFRLPSHIPPTACRRAPRIPTTNSPPGLIIQSQSSKLGSSFSGDHLFEVPRIKPPLVLSICPTTTTCKFPPCLSRAVF